MLIPLESAPELAVTTVRGESWRLSDRDPGRFIVVIFYRGLHCPVCRSQLREAERMIDDFAAVDSELVAISMDNKQRAQTSSAEWEIKKLPIGYGLREQDARTWGLYISEKRPESDEPERFSEPGIFVITSDNTLFYAAVQSMPFSRPPLKQLLDGLKFVIDKNYPARGTLTS